MKQRIVTLVAGGAFTLLISYIVLPLALERWLAPPQSEYRGLLSSNISTERVGGFAPVLLWWDVPPNQRDHLRAKKAARLLLVQGQAFVGDALIPNETIRAYLDARVQSGEIDYVIVISAKKTKWGEIFPVIDECRKSRVRMVLLNHYEA